MSKMQEESRLDDITREVEAVMVRRLERIESENERLRRQLRWTGIASGGSVAILLVLLLVALARTQPGRVAEVVQAREFVLRDAEGMPKVVLSASEDGSSRLVMRDRDGRDRVRLNLLPDGSPGLTFADREGRPRTVLGFLPDETSTLVFADHAGRTRAVLGLSSDQSTTLVFADREGETRVGVGVSSSGRPEVSLYEDGSVPDGVVVDSTPAPESEDNVPAEAPVQP